MGLPAPRRVSGKPFMRIQSASAWTTLELVIRADGSSEGKMIGASPFPRHWVYDADGVLVEKSAKVDFERWYRESHGKHTPWGDEDSPTIATAVESELERELSASIMREGAKLERRSLDAGEALITQGEEGQELFLILDGVVDVEVDGEEVAELGPGTLIGEMALLEGGKRTASVYATTPVRAVVVPRDAVSESALEELAAEPCSRVRRSDRRTPTEGTAMYARLISFSGADPEKRDSAIEMIRGTVIPMLQSYDGFAGLHRPLRRGEPAAPRRSSSGTARKPRKRRRRRSSSGARR